MTYYIIIAGVADPFFAVALIFLLALAPKRHAPAVQVPKHVHYSVRSTLSIRTCFPDMPTFNLRGSHVPGAAIIHCRNI